MSVVELKENSQAALDEGRRLLVEESKAIMDLSESIGGAFLQAVDILMQTKGRVIVTGMGKSGHVGAKIAATLASTGTPAFFVHPGEASHGDLGMITSEDAVIALSHSGGTKELSDIITHCGRFNIPLISVTGKTDSHLAKASTVILLNGVSQEACPMNLAPTTSTTASLALGDALAVALIRLRGFKPEDFAKYHPGGKLGSKLMLVTELMHSGEEMPLVPEGTSIQNAIVMISDKRLGLVGVVNAAGDLTGIFTDGDLRRKISPDMFTKEVQDVMTVNPKTIESTALAQKAVRYMQEKCITSLFVLEADSQKPTGVIHIHDCLRVGVV